MKEELKHRLDDKLPGELDKALSGARINWNKSKEQAWSELEKKLENQKQEAVVKSINSKWRLYALAASIALLTGISAISFLYTKTIKVPAGVHSEVLLPDGSVVKLNAQSSLSFKPVLWALSRKLKFEGEGYFEVTKGRKFEVVSQLGVTNVLGTSFNIYARDKDYRVTCITGKVKVKDKTGLSEETIGPGEQTILNNKGLLDLVQSADTSGAMSWISNNFSFTSTRLEKVFDEIARQYGIRLILPEKLDNIYSGSFRRANSAETVLKLVCDPFDLSFERRSDYEYIISRRQ